MKKKAFFIILALFVVSISVPVFAQTSLKIAVVDTDKVFSESVWGKKTVEEMEKETEKWQQKSEALDKEIMKLEEDLAKQRAFLEDKNKEKELEDQIESKRAEGQTLVQQGNLVLKQKREELLGPILDEMKNVIKKLAVEETYDLVLEKQLIVLYLNPELDITSKVTVMLDKVYKEKFASKPKESEKEPEKEPEKKDTKE